MKILHFSDAQLKEIDEDTALHASQRIVLNNTSRDHLFTLRVLELAKGGSTPWYYYEWEHEIFIHSGNGEILYKDKWIPVTEGYFIYVGKNEDHQIRNRGDEPLLIVSRIPVGDENGSQY